MNTEKEEKLIQELMLKSSEKMPFSDFEDQLMGKIYEDQQHSRSFLKNVKLSWIFFIIGNIFGWGLSIAANHYTETIIGFPSQKIILLIQIAFTILMLTQFSNLIDLTRKNKKGY